MCEFQTPVILGLFKIRGNSNHLVKETDWMTSEAFSQVGNSVTRNKSLILISRKWQVSLKSLQANQVREVQNWLLGVIRVWGFPVGVPLPVPSVPGVWFLAEHSEKNENFHLGGIFSREFLPAHLSPNDIYSEQWTPQGRLDIVFFPFSKCSLVKEGFSHQCQNVFLLSLEDALPDRFFAFFTEIIGMLFCFSLPLLLYIFSALVPESRITHTRCRGFLH